MKALVRSTQAFGAPRQKFVRHSKQFEDVQKEIRERQKRLGGESAFSSKRAASKQQHKGDQKDGDKDGEKKDDEPEKTEEEKEADKAIKSLSGILHKAIAKDDFREGEMRYIDSSRRGIEDDSKDLLTALRRKAEEDRRKGLKVADDDDKQWMIFLQEGLCCFTRGFIMPALTSFTKSINKDKENASEAYVARARCYLKLGKPQKALEDTEIADSHHRRDREKLDELRQSKFIKDDEKDIDMNDEYRRLLKLKVGLMRCRAEALYELSMFERSLIYFHRCSRARPDMAMEFKKGLKKAHSAIANSLTADCFTKCPDLKAVIQGIYDVEATVKRAPIVQRVRRVQFAGSWLHEHRLKDGHHHQHHGAGAGWMAGLDADGKRRKREGGGRRRRGKSIRLGEKGSREGERRILVESEDVAALGKMSDDYGFLKELVGRHERVSGGGFKSLVAREALAFLEERKEFWRQQDPKNCLDTRQNAFKGTHRRRSKDRVKHSTLKSFKQMDM